MPRGEIEGYRYRGARALVLLHERELAALLAAWRQAKSACVRLPATADPDYASLEALLCHVLRSARGYLTWTCEKLGLPEPGARPAPEPAQVEAEAEGFVAHLLSRWRLPLVEVEEPRFNETYETRWGITMCVESMLEHAVLHPMRHRFQLDELRERGGSPAGGAGAGPGEAS